MTHHHPARKRSLAALLLLACLLGAGLLALQREYPDLMVRRLDAAAKASPAHTPLSSAIDDQPAATPPPPESRFTVVTLRPLFTSGRRPPDQPASLTSKPASGPPTGLLVTGIVMAGADSAAIIEPERPGPRALPALVARVGDSVSGWTIEAIEPDLVVLVRDGRRHEMPLIDEDNPRRARAPRRAPAANQLRPAPPQPRRQQPAQQPVQTPQPPVQKIPKIAP